MALIAPGFTFSHQRMPGIDVEQFADSFTQLPPDPHVEGNFRRRKYSRFTGHPLHLRRLSHESFEQSSEINQTYGDIERDFEPIDESVTELPQFEQLIHTIARFFGFNPYCTTLGVHQIRIVCTGDEHGLPVPEGIHQDGFDLIALCCIKRQGVTGAETRLYQSPEEASVYNCTMGPGDIIYCNDRSMYHYTSPIQPVSEDHHGFRDMFVVTVSLDGQQWQETTGSTSIESDNNFQPLPA